MSSIKTTLSSTSSWIKHHTRMHTVVALVVFAVGLAATLYYWNNLRQSVHSDLDLAYSRQARAVGVAATERIELYENFLRGSAGMYSIHQDLTQSEWDAYHQPYEISKKYPDIEGVGLSRYISEKELPAFLDERLDQGDVSYKVFPEGDREVYVPVVFNAQYTGNNGRSKGYDGYTEGTRRKAMDHAIETGEPAVSGKIDLVSESRPDRSSFILYQPIFAQGVPVSNAAERREALLGFTYMAIDVDTFLDSVLNTSQSPHIGLRVYDADKNAEEGLLYESNNMATIEKQDGAKINTSTTELYGHKWHITLAASPSIISPHERQLPDQALWRGILSCLFFAGLVWYLITDRERKYARQKQEEVQTAKDDLLSLASHQLRTPATVVKQYVGMLLQGYGGKMTDQQVGMLVNAYESNERQLEIINQLLYVARLDAGRISLRREKTDISKLMRDVARDHGEAVASRNQQLSFKLPKRAIYANTDPHYLRMVLENLLSNAIKYTPDNGSITMSVRRAPGQIILRVADTGVGIEPELQDSVFEKFTRVENELSNDVNGSGVGLYLTKQIVELHGGTIEVRSAPGQGATFVVRIPTHGGKG